MHIKEAIDFQFTFCSMPILKSQINSIQLSCWYAGKFALAPFQSLKVSIKIQCCVHVPLVYLRVKLIGIDLLYEGCIHETVEHTSHMTNLKHTASLGYFNLLPHNSKFCFHVLFISGLKH